MQGDKAPMTPVEVTAFVRRELDEDAVRAQIQASNAGVLPNESATGVTLDLSHKYIHALPVEVIGLIKDKVERYGCIHTNWVGHVTDSMQASTLTQPADLGTKPDRTV